MAADSSLSGRSDSRTHDLKPVIRFSTLGLLLVSSFAGAQDPGAWRGALSGVVYDSVAGRPLTGATVQITGATGPAAGTSVSATTDSAGRYSFRNIRPGRYAAGFFHDALDTLGLVGEPVAVTIGEMNPTSLDLATPSPRTIIGTVCGAASVTDSVGLLIGHVYATGSSTPIPRATVTVEWGETVIERGGIRQRNMSADATTQDPGWFAM